MNPIQKGNRTRKRLIESLQEDDWEVSIVERVGRHLKEKDAFGLFDLICMKLMHDPETFERHPVCLFVQSTTNTPHAHGPLVLFARKYASESIFIQQWVWKDRKGWVKYYYFNDGTYRREVTFEV